MYHAFKWPALRSDVNFEYTDIKGNVVNNGFHYYTNPSFWDDYRNKLTLLGMLSPEVTIDVIKSIIDKGEKSNGYMPTFFMEIMPLLLLREAGYVDYVTLIYKGHII